MRANRLKAAREFRGYSQEELGEMIGVAKLQIYRWEKARNTPDAETVARLAKVLVVSSDYLLGLTDKPTPQITHGDLSARELSIITALRQGDVVQAIKMIVEVE